MARRLSLLSMLLIGAGVVGLTIRDSTRKPAFADALPARIAIEMQRVYEGCNDIVVHAAPGTPWIDVVNHFSDPAAVYAVWHFDNDLQRYQGIYFADPRAPVDGGDTTTDGAFAIFACVSHDGIIT